jgi:two-component system, chemotaxis family, chemotaxis protein CheY
MTAEPLKVLVVDDEAIWRSTLSRLLKELGCEVTLAHDGHEGLLKLTEEVPDLVVVDLHMPRVDGQAFVERVRTLGGEAALDVVVCSAAHSQELFAVRGATFLMSKNWPLTDLRQSLSRWKDRRTTGSASA